MRGCAFIQQVLIYGGYKAEEGMPVGAIRPWNRSRARTLASYLVTGGYECGGARGGACARGYDGVRSGCECDTEHYEEFEEHLGRFDATVLEGELARLRDRIDAACAEDFEWGQFEVWWHHPARECRVSCAENMHGVVYLHDERFLRALLREARLWRTGTRRRETWMEGRSTVDLAWNRLLQYFYRDRNSEQWRRADWTPSDTRGPGRPRTGV
jgi:hypothetical protein